MSTIKEILKQKGTTVWTVPPDATVFEALKLLSKREVGALPVIEDGRPVGIFSERDYARKIVLRERTSRDTQVQEIMTPNPVCIRPEQTVDEAMALMTAKRCRHLPVVQNDALVGIVSIGDVVKAKIADQKFVIEQLENYISS
jgi:CBS domain-containing protein